MPVLYICAEFEADISIRSKVIRGVPKFRNLVTSSLLSASAELLVPTGCVEKFGLIDRRAGSQQ